MYFIFENPVFYNFFVAKKYIIFHTMRSITGKYVANTAKRISPLPMTFQHFTFVSRKPDLKISRKTTQNLSNNYSWIYRRGYSFSSSKLNELAAKIKEMQEKSLELQGKLQKANTQKLNISVQIRQENEKIAQLESQMKNSSTPNPELAKKIQESQQQKNTLESKLVSAENIINQIKKQKVSLQKEEDMLMSKEVKQDFGQQKTTLWSQFFHIFIKRQQKTRFWSKIFHIFIKNEGIIKRIFSGLIFSFAAYQVYLAKRQDKGTAQYQEEQALLGYNTKQNFDKELKNYVNQSPIQTQMEKIINNRSQNKVLLVAGCPGIGKSTSIKHIIRKLRQKSKDIYYINLKQENTKIEDQIKNMQNLLNAIYHKYINLELNNQSKDKPVKLLIDDINILQNLSKFDELSILMKIFSNSTIEYLQIICISSSGKFAEKISSDTYYSQIQKDSKFLILQDLDESDYEKFAESLIKKYCPNIAKEAKTHMIKQKYRPRDITNIANQLNEIKESEQKKFLQNVDQSLKRNAQNLCSVIFKKEKGPLIRALLQKFVNDTSEKLQIGNCSKIQSQINKAYPLQKDITPIIDELDQRNMIIFCRPRGKIQRNAFQQYLKILTNLEEDQREK